MPLRLNERAACCRKSHSMLRSPRAPGKGEARVGIAATRSMLALSVRPSMRSLGRGVSPPVGVHPSPPCPRLVSGIDED
eukprot:182501-Prorocentrum_minimum.AAC.1